MKKRYLLLGFLLLILLIPFVIGHDGDVHESSRASFAHSLQTTSFMLVQVLGAATLFFVVWAVIAKPKKDSGKWALMLAISIPIIVATLFLAGSTIYKNTIADSKGPVHWHADLEIWDCDEMIDIIDPDGLLNRVGTPVYHEHNENRIH